MSKILYLILITAAGLAMACSKKAVADKAAEPLQGIWVREKDTVGRLPADTLTFSSRSGKNILSFYSLGSPGPKWPALAETEYRFENGKLSYRNYFSTNTDFFEIESFQWITPEKSFSIKLHQIIRLMSADYRVTYHKVD